MDEIVKIVDLYKSYGKKEVIKGISLNVHRGEVFGFLGKNGAGKSTTIDCMVGIKNFNSGHIYINGYSIKKDPIQVKKNIGYVNSEPLCYETMTGREYIRFIASLYQVRENEFDKKLNYLARKFDIANDLDRLISQYSHGMKQKISLISSLIYDPQLLVLDEPTVGLDVMVSKTLCEVIEEYRANNKTVFVTSHNIDFVKKLCDRVAIINNGKIAYLLDLKSKPYLRDQLERIFFDLYDKNKKIAPSKVSNKDVISIEKSNLKYK